FPRRAAAAGAGLRPAGGAAGAQSAAPGALGTDPAGAAGLRLRHQPDAAGHQRAGVWPAARAAGPVVAGAAPARVRAVDVLHRWTREARQAAARGGGGAMRPFPKLHDLLVARVVIGTVLLTWAVLTGLDLVLAMVDELRSVGQGSYDFIKALNYVAHTAPRRAYMMFPTAAVIGSLMGLGQLAASSELTALRALGISRQRLSLSVALPLLLLTGLMMVNAETVGPWAQRSADMMKSAARSNDMIVAQYSGLWAREGD